MSIFARAWARRASRFGSVIVAASPGHSRKTSAGREIARITIDCEMSVPNRYRSALTRIIGREVPQSWGLCVFTAIALRFSMHPKSLVLRCNCGGDKTINNSPKPCIWNASIRSARRGSFGSDSGSSSATGNCRPSLAGHDAEIPDLKQSLAACSRVRFPTNERNPALRRVMESKGT